MIPGAEHAPTIVVGYVTERGGFYTSIGDIPTIERVDTGALIPDVYIEARRQLTVTDPDDQRVIWRLAALRLGASESEAQTSRLRASSFRLGAGPERMRWSLIVDSEPMIVDTDLGNGYINRTVGRSRDPHLCGIGEAHDSAHATAALCAAVWGPA